MPDQGADRQAVLAGVQPVESFNSIDIHNDGGAEDAQIEHGHQALAAGEHPAVLPRIGQNIQRLAELTRRVIVEPGWLQRRSNLKSAGARSSAGRDEGGLLGTSSCPGVLIRKLFHYNEVAGALLSTEVRRTQIVAA